MPDAPVVASASTSCGASGWAQNESVNVFVMPFSPGWAAGLFHRSPDFDLGGPLEFRTSLELAYRLHGGSRLGLCLYHLSNAGLFTKNPGSESLVITYTARVWK